MGYYRFPKYVSVAKRRSNAEKKLLKLKKKNPHIKPVVIEGQTLAKSWWGKSWNKNLERYADYDNRIGRGRSYLRHGSVLDLQISREKINALVQGGNSEPYSIIVKISSLNNNNWNSILDSCHGSFDSLAELLAGEFPKSLKELFFKADSGLFPSPQEITFNCSCPDWALMCKHVAAAMYGVGTRLDEDPSLFFTLRGIDIDDLITKTVTDTAESLLSKAQGISNKILKDTDLSKTFGIDFDNSSVEIPNLPSVKSIDKKQPKQKRRSKSKSTKPQNASKNTMVDSLIKALGRGKKGKSTTELQEKLGWNKSQIRNTARRASTKGSIETVRPGIYRRKTD